MTYQPRPLAANDTLADSRDQIRDNFTIAQTDFAVNHVGYSVSADEGKHKFLNMPVQASEPIANASEGTFYAADDSGGVAQLYCKGESGGSVYQLTTCKSGVDPQISKFGTTAGTDNSGWSFLPGGLIIMYGRKTSPGSSGTITFPYAFPSGNPPFSIVITNERNSGNRACGFDNATSIQFSYYLETSGSDAINWIAIGN